MKEKYWVNPSTERNVTETQRGSLEQTAALRALFGSILHPVNCAEVRRSGELPRLSQQV